eukprot:214278_1
MAPLFVCLLWLIGLNYSQNVPNINTTTLPTLFPTVLASLTTIPSTSPTPSPSTFPSETILPLIDIGCNYVNLGGVAAPVDYCMHVEPPNQHRIVHIKFNCNPAYDGINLEIYMDSECAKKPSFVSDFQDATDFGCDINYRFKKCDEVSIKGYPTKNCAGDIFSEIRLITEACIPDRNNTFNTVECTESSLTINTYSDIPNEEYGTCDEKYWIAATNLEMQSATLDGDRAGCIAVEGCGDYASEHQVIDIGCNYVNFNGFGIPTDECMAVNTEKVNYSYKIYCNDENKLIFGYWTFNRGCAGTPIKELDVSADFQYVCKNEYADISCNTMNVRSYLGDSCDGNEYYDLVFITDVCLYDDTDIYYKLSCDLNSGILSMYQTIDDECIANNLVNTKYMDDEIEVWDMVFGCSEVKYCEVTKKPITTISYTDGPKNVHSHKGWIMMTIIAVGCVSGLIVFVVVLFSLHKYCKQKKEIKIMDQSHSGKNVKNPYGHVDENDDGQVDGNQNVTETDDTLLNA